jgi:hypothetical protein
MHAFRVNPETGARAELERIDPHAQAGLVAVRTPFLADDPRVYAYVEIQYLSTLYLVTGLK